MNECKGCVLGLELGTVAVRELAHDRDRLHVETMTNRVDINRLEAEKKTLREENVALRQELTNLRAEITEIKTERNELYTECNELAAENIQLRSGKNDEEQL